MGNKTVSEVEEWEEYKKEVKERAKQILSEDFADGEHLLTIEAVCLKVIELAKKGLTVKIS